MTNKRTVAVNVKMSEAAWKKIEEARDKLWPGAVMSRSSTVLSMALLTADRVLPKKQKQQKRPDVLDGE